MGNHRASCKFNLRNLIFNVLGLLELAFAASLNLARREIDATSSSTARRHLVVARYDEDVGWIGQLPADFDAVVYQSRNSSAPHYVENYGNEALKYLEYIINEYHNLPDVVTFVHASRHDWHDPQAKEVYLPKVDAHAAENEGGFAFLPGGKTCWYVDLTNDIEAIMPVGARECIDLARASPEEADVLRDLWQSVLQSELGAPPKRWQTACCAQFQVTRAAIQQHPLQFYVSLSDWVREHDKQIYAPDAQTDAGAQTDDSMVGKQNSSAVQHFLGNAGQTTPAPPDHHHDPLERDAGHVMEVIWPLLFSDKSRGADSAPEWRAAPP